MGDRVSIEFKNGDERSVVLFSHWGGMGFVRLAKKYAAELSNREISGCAWPLDRLEPRTVMVDFIREITKGMDRVKGDLYLYASDISGDNSDNGHHIIELKRKE